MKYSKWKALLGWGQSVGIVGGSEELPAWSLGPGTWRGETPFDKIYLSGDFLDAVQGTSMIISGSQTSTILSWRRGCEASQDLTPSSLISLTATSLIIFGAMCTTMIYQLIIAICSPPIPMGQLRIMLALLQRHACCQGSCQACTCSGSSQVWKILLIFNAGKWDVNTIRQFVLKCMCELRILCLSHQLASSAHLAWPALWLQCPGAGDHDHI